MFGLNVATSLYGEAPVPQSAPKMENSTSSNREQGECKRDVKAGAVFPKPLKQPRSTSMKNFFKLDGGGSQQRLEQARASSLQHSVEESGESDGSHSLHQHYEAIHLHSDTDAEESNRSGYHVLHDESLHENSDEDAGEGNMGSIQHRYHSPDGGTGESNGGSSQHQRDKSLHVNWTRNDVARMAREVYDKTIADVHLSLFGYWIRESKDNYDVAKEHIRELGLDKGYNIERIENTHLRQLLKDIHQIRPKEPLHAAAVKLQTLTTTPRYGPVVKNRSTSSPVTVRTDTLPLSFRAERERTMKEAVIPSPMRSVSSPSSAYPPDTPDRPAPLSLRSRSSKASHANPPLTNLSRSVSSMRDFHSANSIPLPLPRNSVMFEATASHPLLTPSTSSRPSIRTSSDADTDDVFAIAESGRVDQSDKGNVRSTSRRYASREPYNRHSLGPYELHALDASSEASYEGDEIRIENQNINDAEGRETEDRPYTSSEDEISVLETASTVSDTGSQIRYSYTLPSPPSEPVASDTASTPSHRRVAGQARRKIQGPNPGATPTNFHRPLPLRSYESEAPLYPTSCSQGGTSHNRVNSATRSIMRNSRPASLAVEPPPFPQTIALPPGSGPVTAQLIPLPPRAVSEAMSGGSIRPKYEEPPTHVEQSGHSDEHDYPSERDSNAASRQVLMDSTLAAFPIPPMPNPVGELQMSVSHATSLVEHTVRSASLIEKYRAITKEYIIELLHRTRDRGAQLPILNYDDLSPFERAWREMNGQLLVSIYGRQDMLLTSQDVQYVEGISRELRDGAPSNDWVREIFQEDI